MDTTDAVVRLQRGDRSALSDLYGAFAQSAIQTAYLITYNQAAAEDAVQESFVQVLRHIATLRDPAMFRSWFFRIVVNSAKRLTRKRFRLLPLEVVHHDQEDPTALPPDEFVLRAEEIEALQQALKELNDTLRLPVILRYLTGLSETEVAEALGIPHGTVKSRLHSARQILHKRLQGRESRAGQRAVAQPTAYGPGEKG